MGDSKSDWDHTSPRSYYRPLAPGQVTLLFRAETDWELERANLLNMGAAFKLIPEGLTFHFRRIRPVVVELGPEVVHKSVFDGCLARSWPQNSRSSMPIYDTDCSSELFAPVGRFGRQE
jgi:hypothetical protein